ncbi:T9SS type A sorting domain-containing protein [Flavobacterium sp. RHBU_3]|uniref:T9SS type A sorting domain-containing protein n=1 Tax=Flavobacterium sp. RHBU_3 TaxID=3391184 RepID=UPI0039847BF1
MKKTLLLGLLLAGFGANAQLTSGTIAPDFTATDINGVEHHLYDYINAGKTVIIDVSATWCSPCWGYHNTHALEDAAMAYGPEASNEVIVLWIEGDPGTSVESLYGTNTASDVSTTQGNWVEGTNYPIIDDGDGSLGSLLDIAYFPTVYKICGTTGVLTELTQPTVSAIRNSIQSTSGTGCGTTLQGVQNYPVATVSDLRLCDSNATVKAKMKNYGKNAITSATLVLEEDGVVVATKSYTGNLTQFSQSVQTFPSYDFDASKTYNVRVTDVNATTPFSTELAEADFDVIVAQQATGEVTVNVYTDNYPTEISWSIEDGTGSIIASGGPYVGSANGGGADANTVKTSTFTVPDTTDCYTVNLYDAYGDGWSLTTQDFNGIELLDANGGTILQQEAGNFGTSMIVLSAFKSEAAAGVGQNELNKFAIYPNPTTGVLNFTTQEAVNVTITDLTGKTVFTAQGVQNGGSINLSNLQTGVYVAQVKGATTSQTQKIIIK